MIRKEDIVTLANEVLETLNSDENKYFIVDVKIKTGNNIQLFIDCEKSISIDDCGKINRYINSKLDREVEDYELEVSSAGISSPFLVLEQYKKNIGKEVEVVLKNGEKLIGKLLNASHDSIDVEIQEKVKTPGSKKKQIIIENHCFNFEQLKLVKALLKF